MRECSNASRVRRGIGRLLIAGWAGLALRSAVADPPASPPPCNVTLGALFCFRVTDIEKQIGDDDKFRFEFEILNWTGVDAAGLVLVLNTGPAPGMGVPPGAPFISGASIDPDGRPLGVGGIPPTGNPLIINDWSVIDLSSSRVCYAAGTPLAHRMASGFDGLLDPDFAAASQATCISALLTMICGSSNQGGNPAMIAVPNIETIDNACPAIAGLNLRDGFVVEIDELDAGEQFSIDWWLIDAAGNNLGIVSMDGAVMGDQYGFGAWNIARLASPAPPPLFNLNTGYDPPNSNNSNADSPMLWAENEVNGVDTFLINPIPAGQAGQGTYFATEFGAAVTAELANPADNSFQFAGLPMQTGVNLCVNEPCGSSGGGVCDASNPNQCNQPNQTPGCNDVACCQQVCAVDHFCCEVAWDSICAAEASQYCNDTVLPFASDGSLGDFAPTEDVLFNTDSGTYQVGTTSYSGGRPVIAFSSVSPTQVWVFDFASIQIPDGVTVGATGSLPLILLSQTGVFLDGVVDVSGQSGGDAGPGAGGGGGGGGGAVAVFAGSISIGTTGAILATGGDGGFSNLPSVPAGQPGVGGAPGPGGGAGAPGGTPDAGGAGAAGGAGGWGAGGGGGGGGAYAGALGAGGGAGFAGIGGFPGAVGGPGACPALVAGGVGGLGGATFAAGFGVAGAAGAGVAGGPPGSNGGGGGPGGFGAGGGGGGGGGINGGVGGTGGAGGAGSGGGGGGGGGDSCLAAIPAGGGGAGAGGGGGGGGGAQLAQARPPGSGGDAAQFTADPGLPPTGGPGGGGTIDIGSLTGVVQNLGTLSTAGGSAPGQIGGAGDITVFGTLIGHGGADGALFQIPGMTTDQWMLAGGGGGGGAGGHGLVLGGVNIVSANPPADNPYVAGAQPFRDVLQDQAIGGVLQGIGQSGTPVEGSVAYHQLSVTFSGTPSPAPASANISVACTGGTYPTVTSVIGSGVGPYQVTLSGRIPPRHCTTLTFAGTQVPGGGPPGSLSYQSLPGDVNMNGTASTADLLALVNAFNNGQAELPANLARYDINRTGSASSADILRLLQLLNGVNTLQPWNGVSVVTCPD